MQNPHILPEILLVDKPIGITSFDVIRDLRKRTGIQKFGHAGTLDPLASGLMILGVEKGTKRLTEFIKLDKEYVTEVRIGESRTTDDLEGPIVTECEVEEIFEDEKISSMVASLVGTHLLPVSAYSAIKKNGKPMYKRAREAEAKGEVVTDVPMREMVVLEAELLRHEAKNIDGKKRYVVTIRFHVESGVYIRSLAKELGKRLGYPATMQMLRRTKIGNFKVEDAKKLADF
jgi:tRNA pseudouridine55 synthase